MCVYAGDRLGFVLQHGYAHDLATLAGLPFPAALKGADRLLFAALQQAGLQPRCDDLALSKV
jgi:hypothetical protein